MSAVIAPERPPVADPSFATMSPPPRTAVRVARHKETTALLGMSIFVASWAMLFAALFFAYGITRARALAWPPADLPALPLGLPALGTVALAAASAALWWALRHPTRARLLRAANVALVGSALFLVVQATVWGTLHAAGLRPDGGPYASVFYGLTTFHAVHIAVGILGLCTTLPKVARWPARTRDQAPLALRLWTVYVHMCGVLWALMFVGVYCL